jgi:multisubunit Na+/H+ antiporter MnhG subunit
VYVTSVLVVVELAAFAAGFLAVIVAPVAAALTVPVTAHAAPRVVKKRGT